MKDQTKNFTIGLFVLVALGVLIFMVLFLHPYLGDRGQILHVRFVDIDKVNIGTRVLYAGKPVGEVVAIYPLDEVQFRRKERKGDIYVYELELAVDSSVKVYNTDFISLRTSGLLGEKSVSIDPRPLHKGQKLHLVNDEVIYADETGSVEDTFMEIKTIARKVDHVLDQASNALDELKKGDTWENLASTVNNLNGITGSLNRPDELAEILTNIRGGMASFHSSMDNIYTVSNDFKEGKGTLGKLFTRDDLYLQVTSLLNKGETIFDDINHYGLLFNSDKGWQRMRARRMNLLQRLSTPQEFRNYFNDEINQISTSLTRVSAIVNQTGSAPFYPDIAQNNEFAKVYAELLRRVSELEESLQMYNNQLVETQVCKTELMMDR